MKTAVQSLIVLSSIGFILTACKADDEESGIPRLSTLGVSEIRSSTAKSGGNIISDGGSQVISRGVVWSDEETPSLDKHKGLTIDGQGSGMFQSTMSDLQQGRSYYIRAYATNTVGTAYGQQIKFITFTDLPTVRTIDVGDITSTDAISGGEVLNEGNAPVDAYGLVWSTDGIPSLANNTDFTSEGMGMGFFTSAITGLTSDKTYFVRAYAVNAKGTGYGNVHEFTTMPCTQIVTEVVEVINPATGRIWMDRNLGSSQAASILSEAAAYGDLYQWGRASDGHQCRTSDATTNILANEPFPGHSNFILSNPDAHYDWLITQDDNLWQGSNGTNNPCPEGFRIPTLAEWEEERQSWSSSSLIGAFESPLKLNAPGYRGSYNGLVFSVGNYGKFWSSTVSGSEVFHLALSYNGASVPYTGRANGFSVRCIKD